MGHIFIMKMPQKTPPPPLKSPAGTPGIGGPGSAAKGGTPGPGVLKRRDSCLEQIQLLQKKRDERRKSMEQKREARAAEEKRLTEAGIPGDVDFQRMIQKYREERGTAAAGAAHIKPGDLKICICVRKRPINEKERRRKDYDAVTCFNPVVMVHDCKLRVDGITKFLDNTDFAFDHTFNEDDTTDQLYHYTAAPLIPFIFQQGRATCFAYGQTGSGKTYTMAGIQQHAARDIFKLLSSEEQWKDKAHSGLAVLVSFFEIYGGRCQDLLNNRHRLIVREDGRGDVVMAGLEESEAQTEEELLGFIEEGNRNRTTHATEVNDVSSRSHAICQITLRHRDSDRLYGKLSLIDLAGSERGADTKSHNRQRRMESAEINKSLLALKECIRALDSDSVHVPYRASKLTLVLKDCFTKENARTVMIATVSPGASSADHTINTLRYADRVKEKNVGEVDQTPYAAVGNEEGGGADAKGGRGSRGRSGDYKGGGGRRDHLGGDFEEEETAWEEQGDDEEEVGDEEFDDETAGGGAAAGRPRASSEDDIDYMHQSLRRSHKGTSSPRGKAEDGRADDDLDDEEDDTNNEDVAELHRAVQSLLDDEEALLNLHMNVIQENADLLTEEGRLLQQIQGDDVVDYDIDAYAGRLEQILDRKMDLITTLRSQLSAFRARLQEEESAAKRVSSMPQY